jgi:hypothetical protein
MGALDVFQGRYVGLACWGFLLICLLASSLFSLFSFSLFFVLDFCFVFYLFIYFLSALINGNKRKG